jgi:hypothetical protein
MHKTVCKLGKGEVKLNLYCTVTENVNDISHIKNTKFVSCHWIILRSSMMACKVLVLEKSLTEAQISETMEIFQYFH